MPRIPGSRTLTPCACCLLAVWLLALCPPAQARPNVVLVGGDQSYPPSTWAEGDVIVGVAIDLLKLVLGDMGMQVRARHFGAWGRVQEAAKNGDVDLITSIYVTPEREKHLVYCKPPYMDDPNVIWVAKGRVFSFRRWEDLVGKRGGVVIGGSYGPAFDAFMRDRLHIEPVPSFEQSARKMLAGRLDYIPYGLYPGMVQFRKLGLLGQVEHLSEPLLSEGLHVAVSRRSPMVRHVDALGRGIRKYRDDGTIDRLIRKHMAAYLATH